MPKYKEIVNKGHRVSVKEKGETVTKFEGQETGMIAVLPKQKADYLNDNPGITGCRYEEVKKAAAAPKAKAVVKEEPKQEEK